MYEHIKEKITIYFSMLSPNERERLLNELGEKYCLHCGYEHPNGYHCQCWNNE